MNLSERCGETQFDEEIKRRELQVELDRPHAPKGQTTFEARTRL